MFTAYHNYSNRTTFLLIEITSPFRSPTDAKQNQRYDILWLLSRVLQQTINSQIKAGFHTIADNRGSQTIVKRVVSMYSQTIADDRRADCLVSGSVKITRALYWREDLSKQHDGMSRRKFCWKQIYFFF